MLLFFFIVYGGFFCDSYVIVSVCIETKILEVLFSLLFTIQLHIIIMHRNWEFIDRHTSSLYHDHNAKCHCRKTERLLHWWGQCHGWGLTLAFHQGGLGGGQSGTGTGFSVSSLVLTLLHVPHSYMYYQWYDFCSNRHKNTS